MNMPQEFFLETIHDLKNKNLSRELREVDGPQGTHLILNGREVLNFCSNDYLGLANDPRLKEAAIETMNKEGFGSGASRLVCGHMRAHQKLEEQLARFKRAERALVFSTGYMANVGIISSLFGRGDIIFSDRLNHASIVDGILLSQAEFKRYPHCDVEALENMLKDSGGFKKRAVITDSVFSMDGDLAPLKAIVGLARKYECLVMIDEAHALGVFGEQGQGLAHHLGLEDKIDIQMGTLSKAAGSFGAYVCGSEELISFLINKARSFIYTTAMPPSTAAASKRAIEIIETDPYRSRESPVVLRKQEGDDSRSMDEPLFSTSSNNIPSLRSQLWLNTGYLQQRLKALGFNTMDSQSPIIPILVKDSQKAVEFSKKLLEEGIFVSAIRPPTVPVNTARLRLTVTAAHTRKELDYLLRKLDRIGSDLELK